MSETSPYFKRTRTAENGKAAVNTPSKPVKRSNSKSTRQPKKARPTVTAEEEEESEVEEEPDSDAIDDDSDSGSSDREVASKTKNRGKQAKSSSTTKQGKKIAKVARFALLHVQRDRSS
jgi:outer membrane biosynthesis protein TonB